jgi:RNAse (barnase) inhibitor barstar
MKTLSDLLHDHKHGGVLFAVTIPPVKELEKQAKSLHMAFFHIEGKKIERKEQFLNHAALAMHFPERFGNNWDAFEDCLTDLSWIEEEVKGYAILCDHVDPLAEHSLSQLETAVEVFKDAVQFWHDQGKKMLVILHGHKLPPHIEVEKV